MHQTNIWDKLPRNVSRLNDAIGFLFYEIPRIAVSDVSQPPLFRSAEPKLRKKYAQILRKEETRRESTAASALSLLEPRMI